MSKIYFQGTFGAYSHLAALSIFKNAEIIPCKTFDECFLKASKDDSSKIIIPESNRITGNIGIEYLIFKYRLNIYSEYFQKIEHNLLGLPGTKISDIKDVYSHGQALSQCSKFIKSNNLIEHVRADTAGSAEMVSKEQDKSKAAIASSLSAKTYNLEIIKKNVENEKGNLTRFLVMGKKISQPEFTNKKYVTSFLFKLKNKPAALYQSLTGMSLRQVDMTKLQSFSEKGTFSSYYFFCEVQGHISEEKVAGALSDVELHCSEFQLLGVFKQDTFRKKST